MSLLFTFQGRITRSTFWVAFAISGLLLGAGLPAIILAMTRTQIDIPLGFIGLGLICAQAWIICAATIRRLHDTGNSGAFALFLLVPVLGLALLAFCTFKAGTPRANAYGYPPGSARFDETEEASGVRQSAPRAAARSRPWSTGTGVRTSAPAARPAPAFALAAARRRINLADLLPGVGRRELSIP